MNEQATKLIEQLAQKLGTTTEYLWSILLKQAPISAMIDLIYLIIATIMGIVLWKLHKYFAKEDEYEDRAEVKLTMVVLTFVWIMFFTICFFSIGDIINGFFNPEYWALKEILRACK